MKVGGQRSEQEKARLRLMGNPYASLSLLEPDDDKVTDSQREADQSAMVQSAKEISEEHLE